jgi:hypothetical protein
MLFLTDDFLGRAGLDAENPKVNAKVEAAIKARLAAGPGILIRQDARRRQ